MFFNLKSVNVAMFKAKTTCGNHIRRNSGYMDGKRLHQRVKLIPSLKMGQNWTQRV